MQFNYNVNPLDLGAYHRGLESYEKRKRAELENQALEQELNKPKILSPEDADAIMMQAYNYYKMGNHQMASETLGTLSSSMGEGGQREIQGMQLQLATDPDAFGARFMELEDKDKVPTKTKEFEMLAKYAKLNDSERRDAARISLGLKPRAVGSASQTITEQGIAKEIAKTERVLAEGKETGKKMAELELAPKIKFAVQDAMLASQMKAEQLKKQKSNEAALAVYEAGISSLTTALGQADVTGPITGSMIAITADDQMADGAVAMMAPIMKQMFRSSGEGTFTDQDQKMLLNMLPSRSDYAAARNFKLQTLDEIVRAKLANPTIPVADLVNGNKKTKSERDILAEYGIDQ